MSYAARCFISEEDACPAEKFTKLCWRYLFFLPSHVTRLSFVFLLLTTVSKVLEKSMHGTWDLWWFITSTGFVQPSHQWDSSNANPSWASFPLRHLCLLHLLYLFSHNSFLSHNLLKGLCTFSLFLTSYECVKTREWAQKAMGTVKCFWNVQFFPHSQHWVSADLSEMQALYSSSWPLNLFSRQ